ncbi:MAG: pilus assembly protein [Acidihalobacter sp.]
MAKRNMNIGCTAGGRRQRGFALIASLLILVILTLLGVSMFSGVGLQERMAGNLRTKTRALNAANAALSAAEQNLLRPLAPLNLSGPPIPAGSSAVPTGSGADAPIVWEANLAAQIAADPTGQFITDALWGIQTSGSTAGSWSSGINFATKPLALDLSNGKLVRSNNDHTAADTAAQNLGYLTAPELYIEQMGSKPVASQGGTLTPTSQQGSKATQTNIYYYRLTARAVGGNASAVAVAQEFFGRIW